MLKSFAHRGRPLSKRKRALLEEVLPKFAISSDGLKEFLSEYKKVNFEIGFGKGDFLGSLAKREDKIPNSSLRGTATASNGEAGKRDEAIHDPTHSLHQSMDCRAALAMTGGKELQGKEQNILNIGCEPYVDGVVSLLSKIQEQGIENIRIWPDDARILLQAMPSKSIDNLFVLFPDPWPKLKQQKRRLVNKEFIKLIAKKLKTSGEVYVATDHHGYADWIWEHFIVSKAFKCEDISDGDFLTQCKTAYHRKNLEGTQPRAFRFGLE